MTTQEITSRMDEVDERVATSIDYLMRVYGLRDKHVAAALGLERRQFNARHFYERRAI